MKAHHPFLIFLFFVSFFSFAVSAEKSKVSFMVFNVENLFDVQHDEGKEDFTYLPLELKRSSKFLDSKTGKKYLDTCVNARFPKWRLQCLTYDWSNKILQQKLSVLREVILSADEGKGADVILLQEVENLRVLKMLNKGALEAAGYRPILIEGQDDRGIDTAMLTRLPIVKTKLHYVPFKGKGAGDTRGILQASLKGPGGIPVEAFSVHFPAPFHPTHMRETALDYMEKVTKDLHTNAIVVVGGDFNITREEDAKTSIVKRYSKKDWWVSHVEGCEKCPGSSYYPPKKDWSFLDQIWVSNKIEKLGWTLDRKSVSLVNKVSQQYIAEPFKRPKRMELDQGRLSGVSDHWPVYLELRAL